VKGQKGVRGQSLIEFAICLPVLILILLGVLDLGRVFHAYVVITNAAREGAYYGSMHPDDHAGIITRVISEAQDSGVTLSAANVAITGSTQTGTPMRVAVQFDFSMLTLYLLGAQGIRLQSQAQMVVY